MPNKILQSIKPVIKLSKFVKINQENIEAICKNFNSQDVQYWMAASPFNLSDLTETEKLNFLFVFNSINFCYWGEPKWTIEYKEKQYDGAWGLIGCLRKAIDRKTPIIQPEYLSHLKQEDLKETLKGNVNIPLFRERLKILRENGEILAEKYQRDFSNVIKRANKDALKLLEIIIRRDSPAS